MAKETFYFSHDFNARNDRKLIKLKLKYRQAGIGIYWSIVEMLFEENGVLPLSEIPTIAGDLREKEAVVLSVINDFDLFENDGKNFWSNSAKRRIDKRLEKSEKAKESIRKRWENTNVLQSKNDSNTIKVKESKVKESKIKNKTLPPEGGESDLSLKSVYTDIPKTKNTICDFIKNKKPVFIDPYFDLWNIFAIEKDLSTLKTLNDNRRRKFNIRIREDTFDFLEILRKAGKSEFLLTGKWFGFDWIIENDSNYLKVLEGNFDKKEVKIENNGAIGRKIQDQEGHEILAARGGKIAATGN